MFLLLGGFVVREVLRPSLEHVSSATRSPPAFQVLLPGPAPLFFLRSHQTEAGCGRGRSIAPLGSRGVVCRCSYFLDRVVSWSFRSRRFLSGAAASIHVFLVPVSYRAVRFHKLGFVNVHSFIGVVCFPCWHVVALCLISIGFELGPTRLRSLFGIARPPPWDV